jgi:hypothetical protein
MRVALSIHFIQQPEGMARLDVSVIVEVPTHGDADESGVGTAMSGLRPVVSMLVVPSVPSANTTDEVSTGTVGVGVQMPDMFDVPNEEVTGSGATEVNGKDVNPGVGVVLLEPITAAVLVAAFVVPVVGQIAIAPRDVPGIGPRFPRLSCTAPKGLPAVPTVGIVPGTVVGGVMGLAIGDIVRVGGPRRVLAEPTWATAVPQPIRTTANIVRSERCIKTSLNAAERPLSISGSSALATAAPCCRRRG